MEKVKDFGTVPEMLKLERARLNESGVFPSSLVPVRGKIQNPGILRSVFGLFGRGTEG